ncbi:MAG: peptidoglycan editing factor PgeF [Granulosicoccus sp.]
MIDKPRRPLQQSRSDALIEVVQPDWLTGPNVQAFSTTRNGGVSQEPYASLNMGLHVGDEQQAVLENRRQLSHALSLPEEPFWMNQTHSTDVLHANSAVTCEGDGAYTSNPGCVLAVLTADCLPVVITTGEELSVIHAGWRGLAGGIVSNAVAMFKQHTDIQAWLGPAIGPLAFEVGEDVLEAFLARRTDYHRFFKPQPAKGKYLCDLYAIARAELNDAGCGNVSGGNYCTFSQRELFHSHRRDGVSSGRMATIAWLTKIN